MVRGRQKTVDLTDRKIGRLTVVQQDQPGQWPNGQPATKWICVCDCGNVVSRGQSSLVSGTNKTSCGCSRKHQPDIAGFNVVLGSYKRSALKRGLAFELTNEQVRALFQSHCRYCGMPPTLVRRYDPRANVVFVYTGIDRVDNSKGYIESNVVSCCKQCNSSKGVLTEDEFLTWICQVYNHSTSKIP